MNLAMIVVEIASHFRATLHRRVWSCSYEHVRWMLQAQTDSLDIPADADDPDTLIVEKLARSFWHFPLRIVHDDDGVSRSSVAAKSPRDATPTLYTPGRSQHRPSDRRDGRSSRDDMPQTAARGRDEAQRESAVR